MKLQLLADSILFGSILLILIAFVLFVQIKEFKILCSDIKFWFKSKEEK